MTKSELIEKLEQLVNENDQIKRQNEYYQRDFMPRHLKEILKLHAEQYPFYGDNGLKNTERHEFLKSFFAEYKLKISELQNLTKIF